MGQKITPLPGKSSLSLKNSTYKAKRRESQENGWISPSHPVIVNSSRNGKYLSSVLSNITAALNLSAPADKDLPISTDLVKSEMHELKDADVIGPHRMFY